MKTKQIVFTKAYTAELLDVEWEAPKDIILEDEERKAMVYGSKLHITFEGKVMHFFDSETGVNLLA